MGWIKDWFTSYSLEKELNLLKLKPVIKLVFLLLLALFFVVLVVVLIVVPKEYQVTDNAVSSVHINVRGIVFSDTNASDGMVDRTWDTADYVNSHLGDNSFFVMTNVIVTRDQYQSFCDEDPSLRNVSCVNDTDCMSRKGQVLVRGNGPLTGRCVQSTIAGYKKVCEIQGWCPAEIIQPPPKEPVLKGAQDSVVLIKTHVEFPLFDYKRRNVLDDEEEEYLDNCLYDAHDPRNRHCPNFRLQTVIEECGIAFEDIAREGGVVQIRIEWNCDLDPLGDDCIPEYTFRRLDSGDFKISRGYNFRYQEEYRINDIVHRTLYKAYGIKFLIRVDGRASKFDWAKTAIALAGCFVYFSGLTYGFSLFVSWGYSKNEGMTDEIENPKWSWGCFARCLPCRRNE